MFDELAARVFRRRYESLDLNVGVVVAEEVLVVDTRASHREADQLLEELQALTRLPVRWAFDTHWQWDHTFGNARYPGAAIWGHRRCREVMEERGKSMITHRARRGPGHSSRSSLRDHRDHRPGVLCGHHGAPRAGEHRCRYRGDRRRGEVHGGSTRGEGAAFFRDSSPASWPATLQSALATHTAALVPGHGDLMDAAAAQLS